MQTSIPDVDGLPSNRAAIAIIKACGDQATKLVADRIAQQDDQPETTREWHAIATAITTLTQANLHMEIALDLLDMTGATFASPTLDAAVSSLGVRENATVKILMGESDGTQAALYYVGRAGQHLELANRTDDPAVKRVHLDIASRYATLRELAERGIVTDPTTQRN